MDQTPYTVPFDTPGWDFEQAMARLHATQRLGISPMLETVVDMLDELGRPDDRFRIIQVAGTNGKTSTSRYTAAILSGEGLKTALYTSPELVSYTERMEVEGRPVSERAFARGVAAAATAGERVNARREAAGERPYDITEFDLLTVAACVAFAEAGVDVAVLEVGMGGRWDATTATHPEVTCVTGIGLDHTYILGDTHAKIAAEKAAVIKRGQRACVLGPGVFERGDVRRVLLDRCAEQEVPAVNVQPVATPTGPWVPLGLFNAEGPVGGSASFCWERADDGALILSVDGPLELHAPLRACKPSYQAQNIATAVALAETFLARPLDLDKLRASVAACPTPGRYDTLGIEPLHLIDASHNPQSIGVFLGSLHEQFPDPATRPALVCAVLADKDVDGIVALLASEFPQVVATQTSSPRALPAEELADKFRAAGANVAGVYPTVAEASAAFSDAPYVACGSITLAGELAGIERPGVQNG